MTESFAEVYLSVSPLLSEFGKSVQELNDSILKGATVALGRPAELDDWLTPEGMAALPKLQEAIDDTVAYNEEAQTLTVPGAVIYSVSGLLEEFFVDANLEAWARFSKPLKVNHSFEPGLAQPRTTETLFRLTPDTRVISFY